MLPKLLLSFLLCCFFLSANAQRFWLTTYSFPGDAKTGLTGSGDSTLYVGTETGVWKTSNQGYSWTEVLHSPFIFSIHATGDTIIAGGTGKIYYSKDAGQNWDSLQLATPYPIREIIGKKGPGFWLSTGLIDISQGYIGHGVLYSAGDLQSWQFRNNGLNGPQYIDKIYRDSYGRMYLSIGTDLASAQSGLYISDNNGLDWEKVDITVDGKNAIENTIHVNTTSVLHVHQDTLYMSFEGVSVTGGSNNIYVRINLAKHRNELFNNQHWKVISTGLNSIWWTDRQFQSLHFSATGDAFSSMRGGLSSGGSLLRKAGQYRWERSLQGLGLDINGNFNAQHYYENSKGKIFMIQYLDFRVYYTDTAFHNTIPDAQADKNMPRLFPNPSEQSFFLYTETPGQPDVQILAINGAIVCTPVLEDVGNYTWKINHQLAPGTYLISTRSGSLTSIQKMMVINP